MRAAQSKGLIDLLVLWPMYWRKDTPNYVPQPWLVQCKRDGRLSSTEEIELKALSELTGAIPVHAFAGPKGRGVVFVNLNTGAEL